MTQSLTVKPSAALFSHKPCSPAVSVKPANSTPLALTVTTSSDALAPWIVVAPLPAVDRIATATSTSMFSM